MANEYELLIKCTRTIETEEKPINYENENISWELLWNLCVYHRVIGFVFPKLKYWDIPVPQNIMDRWKEWGKRTILINQLQKSAFLELASQLNFPLILLKGTWLTTFLYQRDDARSSLDIDILFDLKNKQALIKELNKQGYVQGKLNKKECLIEKADRADIIYKELYTHELSPFIKMSKEVPLYFDCNFKFSWCGSKQYKAPQAEFSYCLQHSRIFEGKGIKCISFVPELFFIHLCVHFYNEYHFFMFDERADCGQIRLYQICDIRFFIQKVQLSKELIRQLVTDIGAEEQIQFCIQVSHMIYMDDILDEIFDMEKEGDINIYFDRNGNVHKWPISIEERLMRLPLNLE